MDIPVSDALNIECALHALALNGLLELATLPLLGKSGRARFSLAILVVAQLDLVREPKLDPIREQALFL